MKTIVATLLGISFSALVYYIISFRFSKNKNLELIDWFLLALGTFNGVLFSFVVITTLSGKNASPIFTLVISKLTFLNISSYIFFNILILVCVSFGWSFTKLLNKKCKIKKFSNEYKDNYLNKLVFFSWFLLIVSIFSYWLYVKAYGGFLEYIPYSRAIRSGVFTIRNPFSFLQRFGGFAFLSSYLFFSFILDRTKRKKSFYFGFIISFLFSTYVLYSWVGRVSFVIYLGTFLLGLTLNNYRSILNFTKRIIYLLVGLFIVLVSADTLLRRSSGQYGLFEILSKELSFPLVSYLSVVQSAHYRWFIDLIIFPFYILPMRIWSGLLGIETASSYNTFLLLGKRKGETGVFGELPLDFLSFSYLQANILGVIVVSLVFGIFLFLLQRSLNKIPLTNVRSIISANVILNIAVISVLYADPQHIIAANFPIIMGFIIFVIFFKIKAIKFKRINIVAKRK